MPHSAAAPNSSEGSALAPSAVFFAKAKPIPPGAHVGVLLLFLANRSDRPVTLDDVATTGEGIGSVVKATSIEAAPIPRSDDARTFAPGGLYVVDPPAFLFSGADRCNVQLLRSVHRFTLAPGRQARVRIILRAAAEGEYELSADSVTYFQGGRRYVQRFEVGIRGTVEAGARTQPVPQRQAACVGSHGVQLLDA